MRPASDRQGSGEEDQRVRADHPKRERESSDVAMTKYACTNDGEREPGVPR